MRAQTVIDPRTPNDDIAGLVCALPKEQTIATTPVDERHTSNAAPIVAINLLRSFTDVSTQNSDLKGSDDNHKLQLEREPKELVCQRCWNEIFTSRDFAKACWAERGRTSYSAKGFNYHISIDNLLESANEGCNWCQLVLGGEGRNGIEIASASPSTQALVRFGNCRFEDEDVRRGYNFFYLSLKIKREASWDLFAYASPGNIAMDFVKARRLEPKVDTDEAFTQAKAWIRDCDFHEHCFEQKETNLPTRVIEVSPAESPNHPKLLVNCGVGYYAVLSYCWGGDHTGVTTLANLESRLICINQAELSLSIRDAIHCTKRLGLKYLWVDAICIVQDSDNDKIFEVANMRNIYQQSHITIVAASSASSRDGFLGDRAETKYFDVPFPCPSNEMGTMSLAEGRYFPEGEPIHQRGWTLQEYLLSPRLLLYTSIGIEYRCHTVALGPRESRDPRNHRLPPYFFRPRREKIKLTSKRTSEVLEDWAWIVKEFTRRKLSCSGDRLSAVAGIAELFSNLLNSQYMCGLWHVHLLPQLLWFVNLAQYRRPAEYRAPSWSWASVDDSIWYNQTRLFAPFRCELLDCEIELRSHTAPFGSAISGKLKLKAALHKAWYKHPFSILFDGLNEHQTKAENTTVCNHKGYAKSYPDNFDSNDSDSSNGSNDHDESRPFAHLDSANIKSGWVYCLVIGKTYSKSERLREFGDSTDIEGLMLVPVSLDNMIFRRIGCFSQRGGALSADWTCREVVII